MKTYRNFARYFSVLVLICAVCGTAAGAPADGMTLDEAIQEAVKTLINQIPPATPITVSGFKAPTDDLSNYIMDKLREYIKADGSLNLQNRDLEFMQRREEELAIQYSGGGNEEISMTGIQGAFVTISGSITQVGSQWAFLIDATDFENTKTLVNRTIPVKRDGNLITLLDSSGSSAAAKTWSDFRLELGARVGVSPRFYTLSDDINGSASNGASFEGAAQVTALFLSFNLFGSRADLAAQMELMFTHDTVNYTTQDEDEQYSGAFSYLSLRIPVLVGLLVEFDRFSLAVFTGPHFTIPLGKMSYEVGGDTTSFDCSVPMGWTVGMQGGMTLGAGMVVTDIRYAADSGRTSIDGAPGTLPVFSRSMLSFSIGYKFRFRF